MAPTMVSEAMPDATRILTFFSSVDRVPRVHLCFELRTVKTSTSHANLITVCRRSVYRSVFRCYFSTGARVRLHMMAVRIRCTRRVWCARTKMANARTRSRAPCPFPAVPAVRAVSGVNPQRAHRMPGTPLHAAASPASSLPARGGPGSEARSGTCSGRSRHPLRAPR